MKILIAEDDLVSRNFLCKFLSKYGDCDLVVDGLEALDAFLMALKDKDPYRLIYLDIMMPKADGVQTLKAIRDLEKQYGIVPEDRAKIIMTTALAETQLVQTAFEYGCEAYAVKPIDTEKLLDVLKKLGLIEQTQQAENTGIKSKYDKKDEITTKIGIATTSYRLICLIRKTAILKVCAHFQVINWKLPWKRALPLISILDLG